MKRSVRADAQKPIVRLCETQTNETLENRRPFEPLHRDVIALLPAGDDMDP